jgi:FkbM family methyltransferase
MDFKRLIDKVIRGLIIYLTKLNSRLPGLVELDAQGLQGKGVGASSLKLEVSSSLGLFNQKTDRKIVAFDIGANVGDYSVELLENKHIARVYSFEPSKFTFQILKKKFENHSRIELINSAIGAFEGTTTLWKDSEGSGLASLTHRNLDHFGLKFDLNESVHVTTLDTWCAVNGVSPDFIKIDVEGHELDVLKGGLETLQKCSVVQFEFGGCNIDTRTYFQDFWRFFNEQGFTLYRITPRGLLKISAYLERDECFRTTNYVAVNAQILLTLN